MSEQPFEPGLPSASMGSWEVSAAALSGSQENILKSQLFSILVNFHIAGDKTHDKTKEERQIWMPKFREFRPSWWGRHGRECVLAAVLMREEEAEPRFVPQRRYNVPRLTPVTYFCVLFPLFWRLHSHQSGSTAWGPSAQAMSLWRTF